MDVVVLVCLVGLELERDGESELGSDIVDRSETNRAFESFYDVFRNDQTKTDTLCVHLSSILKSSE